ncbi:SDR family NAD(P)-dependent oxidoreductase [Pseudonocardia sp. RS010]|uniref:SDR family NAD(P)-dependent oxidoreductase n=1 Tax=Pseudonocardia sp. RS010 TaxID=3385979 RepID=UPI0039A3D2B0
MARRSAPAGAANYAASKAALEAVASSLRLELEPLGIAAMVVEPGAFRTDLADRSPTQSAAPIPDHAQTAGLRRRENDRSDGPQPGDPDRAGAAILTAVEAPKPPALALVVVRIVRVSPSTPLSGNASWSTTTSRSESRRTSGSGCPPRTADQRRVGAQPSYRAVVARSDDKGEESHPDRPCTGRRPRPGAAAVRRGLPFTESMYIVILSRRCDAAGLCGGCGPVPDGEGQARRGTLGVARGGPTGTDDRRSDPPYRD